MSEASMQPPYAIRPIVLSWCALRDSAALVHTRREHNDVSLESAWPQGQGSVVHMPHCLTQSSLQMRILKHTTLMHCLPEAPPESPERARITGTSAANPASAGEELWLAPQALSASAGGAPAAEAVLSVSLASELHPSALMQH